MQTRRIHIVGASGAGVTTLGRAVADALAIPHHDTDGFYWLPTDPPYSQTRDIADRLRLMHEMFIARPDWVLSGSLDEWGGPVLALFDLVAFLYVPTEIRLHRLRDRNCVAARWTRTFSNGLRTMTTARARDATCRVMRCG